MANTIKAILILIAFLLFTPFSQAKNIRADGSDDLNLQTGGKNTRLHINSTGSVFFDLMTQNRVPYFGASGEFLESLLFTFDGSDLLFPITNGTFLVGSGANQKSEVTISGDATISNTGDLQLGTGVILDGDVNTNANIARTKLAGGTINHVLINDGSGDMSSEAQLATSRGGTGVNSTAVFPSSGTVVTTDASQALSNKTINASVNTISNITNTEISASAAIARSKMANGTANHVVINNGTGGLSSEAQLAGTRGGTGVSSTATFPTSGTVMTRDATEDISNKTFTDEITLTELGASPGTPATGDKLLYCLSGDGKCYFKNDAGTEVEIGTGATVDPVVFRSWVQYAALSTPATGVNIDFDAGSIDIDTDSGWDSVNNYYVIPEDGYYIVTAGVTFVNMAYTFIYYVSLYDTGVEVSNYWDVANRFEPAAAQGVQDFGGSAYPTGPAFFSTGDQISVRTSTKTINASESGSVRHILSIVKY